MSKHKKPYIKPEITIILVGSPKHNEIMTLLKTEDSKVKQQADIPLPLKPK